MCDVDQYYRQNEENAHKQFVDRKWWKLKAEESTVTFTRTLRDGHKIQITSANIGKKKWQPIVTLNGCISKKHPCSFHSEEEAIEEAWILFKGLCLLEVVNPEASSEIYPK